MTKKYKLISEDSFAASTLTPQSMPATYETYDSDVEKALDHFNALNTKQRERVRDIIQKIYLDTATGKGTFGPALHEPYHGAGVGDVAASNRQLQLHAKEEAYDWPSVAEFLLDEDEVHEALEERLSQLGFTEDALPRAAEMFYEAVQDSLNNSPFQKAITAFVEEYGFSPLIESDQLDVVGTLVFKIQTLENRIAFNENVNAQLAEEIEESLSEENSYTTRNNYSSRSPRRSTVANYLNEPTDEENAFDEDQEVIDLRMRSYLKAFGNE